MRRPWIRIPLPTDCFRLGEGNTRRLPFGREKRSTIIWYPSCSWGLTNLPAGTRLCGGEGGRSWATCARLRTSAKLHHGRRGREAKARVKRGIAWGTTRLGIVCGGREAVYAPPFQPSTRSSLALGCDRALFGYQQALSRAGFSHCRVAACQASKSGVVGRARTAATPTPSLKARVPRSRRTSAPRNLPASSLQGRRQFPRGPWPFGYDCQE